MFSALAAASQLAQEQQQRHQLQRAPLRSRNAASHHQQQLQQQLHALHSNVDIRESGDDWISPYHVNLLEYQGRPINLYGSPSAAPPGDGLPTGLEDDADLPASNGRDGAPLASWSRPRLERSASAVTEAFDQHEQLAEEAAHEASNSGLGAFIRRSRLRRGIRRPHSLELAAPTESLVAIDDGSQSQAVAASTSSQQESGSSREGSSENVQQTRSAAPNDATTVVEASVVATQLDDSPNVSPADDSIGAAAATSAAAFSAALSVLNEREAAKSAVISPLRDISNQDYSSREAAISSEPPTSAAAAAGRSKLSLPVRRPARKATPAWRRDSRIDTDDSNSDGENSVTLQNLPSHHAIYPNLDKNTDNGININTTDDDSNDAASQRCRPVWKRKNENDVAYHLLTTSRACQYWTNLNCGNYERTGPTPMPYGGSREGMHQKLNTSSWLTSMDDYCHKQRLPTGGKKRLRFLPGAQHDMGNLQRVQARPVSCHHGTECDFPGAPNALSLTAISCQSPRERFIASTDSLAPVSWDTAWRPKHSSPKPGHPTEDGAAKPLPALQEQQCDLSRAPSPKDTCADFTIVPEDVQTTEGDDTPLTSPGEITPEPSPAQVTPGTEDLQDCLPADAVDVRQHVMNTFGDAEEVNLITPDRYGRQYPLHPATQTTSRNLSSQQGHADDEGAVVDEDVAEIPTGWRKIIEQQHSDADVEATMRKLEDCHMKPFYVDPNGAEELRRVGYEHRFMWLLRLHFISICVVVALAIAALLHTAVKLHITEETALFSLHHGGSQMPVFDCAAAMMQSELTNATRQDLKTADLLFTLTTTLEAIYLGVHVVLAIRQFRRYSAPEPCSLKRFLQLLMPTVAIGTTVILEGVALTTYNWLEPLNHDNNGVDNTCRPAEGGCECASGIFICPVVSPGEVNTTSSAYSLRDTQCFKFENELAGFVDVKIPLAIGCLVMQCGAMAAAVLVIAYAGYEDHRRMNLPVSFEDRWDHETLEGRKLSKEQRRQRRASRIQIAIAQRAQNDEPAHIVSTPGSAKSPPTMTISQNVEIFDDSDGVDVLIPPRTESLTNLYTTRMADSTRELRSYSCSPRDTSRFTPVGDDSRTLVASGSGGNIRHSASSDVADAVVAKWAGRRDGLQYPNGAPSPKPSYSAGSIEALCVERTDMSRLGPAHSPRIQAGVPRQIPALGPYDSLKRSRDAADGSRLRSFQRYPRDSKVGGSNPEYYQIPPAPVRRRSGPLKCFLCGRNMPPSSSSTHCPDCRQFASTTAAAVRCVRERRGQSQPVERRRSQRHYDTVEVRSTPSQRRATKAHLPPPSDDESSQRGHDSPLDGASGIAETCRSSAPGATFKMPAPRTATTSVMALHSSSQMEMTCAADTSAQSLEVRAQTAAVELADRYLRMACSDTDINMVTSFDPQLDIRPVRRNDSEFTLTPDTVDLLDPSLVCESHAADLLVYAAEGDGSEADPLDALQPPILQFDNAPQLSSSPSRLFPMPPSPPPSSPLSITPSEMSPSPPSPLSPTPPEMSPSLPSPLSLTSSERSPSLPLPPAPSLLSLPTGEMQPQPPIADEVSTGTSNQAASASAAHFEMSQDDLFETVPSPPDSTISAVLGLARASANPSGSPSMATPERLGQQGHQLLLQRNANSADNDDDSPGQEARV